MARDCWTCTNDSRATLVASIYGLVVAVIWVILAFLALLTVRCKLPSLDESLLILLYFFNPRCEWAVPRWLEDMQPGWPAEDPSTPRAEAHARPAVDRTLALAATRFSLAAARAIASIALIVAERYQSKQRREGQPVTSFFVIYFGWLLMVLLDCVLDAIIISIYATDIAHSKNAHNVFRLLGVSVIMWEDAKLPAWVTDSPALPPVVMMLVGGRLAPVIWVLEGVIAARVAAAARHIQQWNDGKNRRRLQDEPSDAVQTEAQVAAGRSGPRARSGAAFDNVFSPVAAIAGASRPPPPAQDLARPMVVAVEEKPAEVTGVVEVATVEVHRWEEDPEVPGGSGRSSLTKRHGDQRSSWGWWRLSFLEHLKLAGGGGGQRDRWSYLPLDPTPTPSPPPLTPSPPPSPFARRRAASQPPFRGTHPLL